MYAAPAPRRRPTRRPGAILLVVLALLALFAVVGLSFATYAEAEATASRIKREAVDQPDDVIDPNPFVNQFFQQFLYDCSDNGVDVMSALRGHSMARLVYGQHATLPNLTPYNGLGTLSETLTIPLANGGSAQMSRREAIHFGLLSDPDFAMPANSAHTIVDPENTNWDATGTIRSTTGTNNPASLALPTYYAGKNGNWTYPDRNNMAVAMIDPATGSVLVPSYFRPLLFGPAGTTTANWQTNGTLQSTNQNWGNGSPAAKLGKYKILRPRPEDQKLNATDTTQFPYPPMNPDGTYTGDVQNLWFLNGIQKNDSLWMYTGAPVTTYKDKKITALVAPLIIPLDGRINAAVAGNMKKTGNDHASNQGFGVWEQNLQRVLRQSGANAAEEARRLIAWRYGNDQNQATNGPTTTFPALVTTTAMPGVRGTNPPIPGRTWNVFAGTNTTPLYPPDYARIDWDGTGSTAQTFPYPTGVQSDPTWTGPATGTDQWGNGYYNAGAGEAADHPSLFNPYTWAGNTTSGYGRTMAMLDFWPFQTRYSRAAGKYPTSSSSSPGYLAPDSFAGTWNNTKGVRATYPGDGSDPVRARVTFMSNSQKRAAMGPAYFNTTTGQFGYGSYRLGAGANQNPFIDPTSTNPVLTFPVNATGSDFENANSVRSSITTLGAIDLNRTFVDYRGNPVATVTPGNFDAAWADRHAFAQEVFARLVLATGAAVPFAYDPATRTFSKNAPPGTAVFDSLATGSMAQQDQFRALRWLAQLAANIVDYIDDDDVSTTFVWNPKVFSDPRNYTANVSSPAEIPNRMVFGVEKPRLVLNEAYSEIVNHPMDAGANMKPANLQDFRVRFWVELLNPGNTRSVTTGIAGDGTVQLYDMATSTPVYKVQVYGPAAMAGRVNQILTNLGDPANVTGFPLANGVGTDPKDRDLDFGWAGAPTAVTPNDAENGPSVTAANKGFLVVGQDVTGDPPAGAGVPNFRPGTYGTLPQTIAAVPSGNAEPKKLEYTTTATNGAGLPPLLEQHVVVLRKLACPYMPANDPNDTAGFNPANPVNPYVTVDYMTNVQPQDALRYLTDTANNAQHMFSTERRALGRRQPVAAAYNLANLNQYKQQTLDSPTTPPGNSNVYHSFFKHNDAMTRDASFDWFVHNDRPPVNPFELRHVTATTAHELTHRFISANAPAPGMGAIPATDKFQHLGNWGAAPLYRAFESLAVRPWMHTVPEGGRTPGRVNVNMIWDQTVLDAVLDPQGGNTFSADATFTNGLWSSLFFDNNVTSVARTKGTSGSAPGNTLDDLPATATVAERNAADQPFKGFGVGTFKGSKTTPDVTSGLPFGSGVEDTLLRKAAGGANPLIFRTGTGNLHPHEQDEALRKLFNSLTTTSDSYLVLLTVGFFEVRGDTAGPTGYTRPVLGKEVFKDAPGDLRVQFAAVVDRTNFSLATLGNATAAVTAGGTVTFDLTATGSPAFPTNPTLSISGTTNGQLWTLAPGSQLVFGDGPTAEKVTVQTVQTLSATTARVTFQSPSAHGLGEPISLANIQGDRPWFTTLAAGVQPGPTGNTITVNVNSADANGATVNYEGQQFLLSPPPAGPGLIDNSYVRLGSGSDAEWVRVSSVGAYNATDGTVQITLSAAVTKPHGAGAGVGRTVTGNPGPQANFDYTAGWVKPLLPLVTRLTP